ncbi:MAG TPA: FixH family protein [Burkholderiales bacterium]|nr:FixH family protein [Burkholderiales bacterium]
MNACDARPWYREPWPWLLMAGPAIVVVAGAVTMWLAIHGNDGLVADDYYKRGLAINQVLARDQAARAHGYTADVAFDFNHGRVRVALAGDALPPALLLSLTHPTRAAEDRIVPLARVAAGAYEGVLHPPASGRWRLSVEDARRTWRLNADWHAPQDVVLKLGVPSS